MTLWARDRNAAHRRTRRWVLAGTRLPAGALLAGVILLCGSVPASAQALTWSVVPSPGQGTSRNVLQGMSCASATFCMAVGDYYASPRLPRGLIESWNGTRWSVVPSPNRITSADGSNSLAAVSCVSATACMAVGSYSVSSPRLKTLVESWDGTRWSLVPGSSPGTNPVLDSISCTSAAACTAAGTYYKRSSGVVSSNLIESWNGAGWSVVPSPNGAGYNAHSGVSCTSATACMAVGADNISTVFQTLIESWTAPAGPSCPAPTRPATTSSMACPAPRRPPARPWATTTAPPPAAPVPRP